MQVLIPDMQPVRINRTDEVPDFQTYFPNLKNITHRFEWFQGLHATEYYTDFLINKQLSFQLALTVEGTEDINIYKYNSDTDSYDLHTTISPLDISPAGWQLNKVNRYDFTPTAAGVYYFESTSAEIRSDKFIVHSDLKYRKRLCEIVYYNTVNEYFMIFFDNGTQRYTGMSYFTATIEPSTPGTEISAFETDRGNLIKTRTTPINKLKLILADIHLSEIRRVNMIFSCDYISVNGVTYQNEGAIEVDPIENSDLVNITIELTETNYNYYK